MAKEKDTSTRAIADLQEKAVCKALGAMQQPSSGSGKWRKGDVIHRDASILIECKTCMTDKDSFSIKKEWIAKNKEEVFTQRVSSGCIAYSYGPGQPNYYVIDEKLMQFLIEKLIEENK